jgi:hypothetical protein
MLRNIELTMERFADHPELEAQFMRDELPVIEAELWTDYQPWEVLGKTFVTTRRSV